MIPRRRRKDPPDPQSWWVILLVFLFPLSLVIYSFLYGPLHHR